VPVYLSPDKDDLAIAADPKRRNNFAYEGDDEGLGCPLGAHLRRGNPRATRLTRATGVRRHRLIRRGVEYGPHLGAKRPFLFDLPTFDTVKGGEYLFVPELNAPRALSNNASEGYACPKTLRSAQNVSAVTGVAA
jgi:hypothetical protein